MVRTKHWKHPLSVLCSIDFFHIVCLKRAPAWAHKFGRPLYAPESSICSTPCIWGSEQEIVTIYFKFDYRITTSFRVSCLSHLLSNDLAFGATRAGCAWNPHLMWTTITWIQRILFYWHCDLVANAEITGKMQYKNCGGRRYLVSHKIPRCYLSIHSLWVTKGRSYYTHLKRAESLKMW